MLLYQILLFVVVLTILLSETSGRGRKTNSCKGKPARESCTEGMDAGTTRGRRCGRNANNGMWYHDTARRTCMPLSYKGCGGNGNRFCTKQACEAKCRR